MDTENVKIKHIDSTPFHITCSVPKNKEEKTSNLFNLFQR